MRFDFISWGISAVGSASHWQCEGQGFESPMLHQKNSDFTLFREIGIFIYFVLRHQLRHLYQIKIKRRTS